MSTCATLLLKNPEPGRVKTRLQPCFSAAVAAELYRAFILDSAEILAGCSADSKVVAYDPPGAEEQIRDLLSAFGFTFAPQPQGDLGRRMERLLHRGVEEGADRAIIIGSDSPSLPSEYLDEALETLQNRQVVLGPSTDGGYYLVGARIGGGEEYSRLFADIEWGTGSVLEQTLSRMEEIAIADNGLGLLPVWYDVDTPEDAAFLKIHLQALERSGVERGSHSLSALQKLDLPPPS